MKLDLCVVRAAALIFDFETSQLIPSNNKIISECQKQKT